MTEVLPHCRAAQLPDVAPEKKWLVEGLWGDQGVGIIGGAPKCCKSWLGLDLVVSVASGTPCLGRHRVPDAGSVLCYLAEDNAAEVKQRLRGICASRELDLAALPVEVITSPVLRLDLPQDQRRLEQTVATLRPRLLLLDPFVRLHRIDENDAGQVSAVLAYLRTLQRAHGLAVAVVHHARKNGTGVAAGQTLRGSSDFHAWGDSNLYLRRGRDSLVLTVEHRCAGAPEPVPLRLVLENGPHLEVAGQSTAETIPDRLAYRVVAELKAAAAPLTRAELRATLKVRNENLGHTLTCLLHSGAIQRMGDTWFHPGVPVPPLQS